MKLTIISEYGYDEAALGLSLSYGTSVERAKQVMAKLAHKDGGHNKFLESITVYLDMTYARYFWSQFDTYRIGVTKQSESTMHTITKKPLSPSNFEPVRGMSLDMRFISCYLNSAVNDKDIETVKALLPESFLQRRIVCTNYKALRGIVKQRRKHKLKEWKHFCTNLVNQLERTEFTKDWL